MEDYSLFARMLAGGARAVNVPEPLVFYRVGAQAFKRRGGLRLLRSELRLQTEFRQRRFTSAPEYVRNVAIRGGYRLVPWWCRRAVYRPIVTRYTDRLESEPGGRPDPEPPEFEYAGGLEYAGSLEYAEMSAAGFWRDPPAPVST